MSTDIGVRSFAAALLCAKSVKDTQEFVRNRAAQSHQQARGTRLGQTSRVAQNKVCSVPRLLASQSFAERCRDSWAGHCITGPQRRVRGVVEGIGAGD